MSGHPFPSSLSDIPTRPWISITSLQRSSTTTAYVKSYSQIFPVLNWRKSLQMQEPFQALTYLELHAALTGETQPPILGGPAPHLQVLVLSYNPIRELPKLLFSATNLVILTLLGIPHSRYISSGAMFTCLSTLTSLKMLWLGFGSPLSRPDRERRRPPPLTPCSSCSHDFSVPRGQRISGGSRVQN